MNEKSSKEWLVKAWHHLSSAKVLYDASHYTDCIAVDLHYSIEISLKSLLAYENKKILRSHDLLEIHATMVDVINFTEDDLTILDLVTSYHIKEAYPAPERRLPSLEEIEEVLYFANELLERVCKLLNISIDEIKAL